MLTSTRRDRRLLTDMCTWLQDARSFDTCRGIWGGWSFSSKPEKAKHSGTGSGSSGSAGTVCPKCSGPLTAVPMDAMGLLTTAVVGCSQDLLICSVSHSKPLTSPLVPVLDVALMLRSRPAQSPERWPAQWRGATSARSEPETCASVCH